MSDLLSWLRATIEGDKVAAEALDGEIWTAVKAHGDWHIQTSQDQTFGGDSEWGDLDPCEAVLIAAHGPRDVIARCEAELALLVMHEDLHDCVTETGSQVFPAGDRDEILCPTIRALAQARRYRPGFNLAWLEEAQAEELFDWARTEERIADGQITDPAWLEVSRAGSAVRAALGLTGSMREVSDVPHPFVAAKGDPYDGVQQGHLAQYCAACGCIRSLIAHKESWVDA
ncbi:DUF6221 family protein [Nonomuraea sp. NPDC026600]|uniref:DUF6221 family protein n=1 Tax=Nonomuraea sp. NPDC026600 TaxID=3155363 RepID=UPI0033D90FFF